MNIKLLCKKEEALCFVGIGWIGKTTLAKATLNDMKYMYKALHFVKIIKHGVYDFSTICKVLEQLNIELNLKDFEEPQKMIKKLLIKIKK